MNNPTAYNYDTQQWVTGPGALALRIKQLEEELALFKSPRGEEYARCIGAYRENAIARIEMELAALNNQL
jgi:hypothetical protein